MQVEISGCGSDAGFWGGGGSGRRGIAGRIYPGTFRVQA